MTVSILTGLPITREEDAFGQILGGGLLTTTQAGSDVPLATFQDINCTVTNTNPVVLDSTGRAFVRYQMGVAYKLKLTDQAGTVLWTVDNFWPPLSTEPVSALSFISGILNPITPAEITAGLNATTVPNLRYPQGHPLRYGATLDGITDDTVALQNWAKVPGTHTFPGAMSSIVSNVITMVSNSKYEFGEGSLITQTQQDISILQATNANNITVRGGKFAYTAAGNAANIGGVALNTCSDCLVEDCEFTQMQFAGIYASAAQRCTFRNNYIHDFLGAMLNSADIYVPSSPTLGANNNIIDGNQCFGGNSCLGIAVWDPYSGTLPYHNIICNNRIANHNGYGILLYMPDTGDSYTQVIGNTIENISAFLGLANGLPAPNTDSGAGIYMVGAGMGGSQIIGNIVRNCCITTTTQSLAPAGIGAAANNTVGQAPIVIQGNMIEDMTRFHSILVTGCLSGASVIGNTIRHPPQAAGTFGDCIRITNSNNVSVIGNTITNLGTAQNSEGISLWAQGATNTNIAVTSNTITGGHHAQIRCVQTGGNVNQFLSIANNVCSGGDLVCVPLMLDTVAAQDVTVTGNIFNGSNAACITQAACLNVCYENNRLRSTGSPLFTTSGACTGGYFGISNLGIGNGALVSNAGTGFVMDVRGAVSAPVAGTWAVGDTSRNMTATGTATVFLNVCTVAGTPGTWKTISNT